MRYSAIVLLIQYLLELTSWSSESRAAISDVYSWRWEAGTRARVGLARNFLNIKHKVSVPSQVCITTCKWLRGMHNHLQVYLQAVCICVCFLVGGSL